MHQHPATIWNAVAALGSPLATRTFAALFPLDQPQLDQALASLTRRLERSETDPTVLRAWLTVMPLLMENVAISRAAEDEPALRQALPEVVTVSEALQLATREFNLMPPQVKKLQTLIRMPLPSPGA